MASSNRTALNNREKTGTILISFGFDGLSSRSVLEGESAIVAALSIVSTKQLCSSPSLT
jgi:hypothetical protein